MDKNQRKALPCNWSNNSSRYYNQRKNGVPVTREYEFNKLEEMLLKKGISYKQILCHPIWQLIDNKNPSLQSVSECLSNLPPQYTSKLFKGDRFGHMIRNHKPIPMSLKSIHNHTCLDSLCCWIAFCLETQNEWLKNLDLNQMYAVKMYMRLSAETPFSEIANELYLYINQQFNHLYDKSVPDLSYSPVKLIRQDQKDVLFPIRLISDKPVPLQPVVDVYKEMGNRAIELNIIKDSKKERMQMLTQTEHIFIQATYRTLFQGTRPTKNTQESS